MDRLLKRRSNESPPVTDGSSDAVKINDEHTGDDNDGGMYAQQLGDLGEKKEEEEDDEETLRADLEALRAETRQALERTWAEVERLQTEGSESSKLVEDLERELADIRLGQEQQRQLVEEGKVTDDQIFLGDDDGGGVGGKTTDDESVGGLSKGGLLGGIVRAIARAASPSPMDVLDVMPGNSSCHGIATDGGLGSNRERRGRMKRRFSESALSGTSPSIGTFETNIESDSNSVGGLSASLLQQLRVVDLSMDANDGGGASFKAEHTPLPQLTMDDGDNLSSYLLNGDTDDDASAAAVSCSGLFSSSGIFASDEATRPAVLSGGSKPPSDLASHLQQLEESECRMLTELETRLHRKQSAIETLDRTAALQDQTLSELEREMDELMKQEEEERLQAAAEVPTERKDDTDTKKVLELEAEVLELERTLEIRKERERVLRHEWKEMENKVRMTDRNAADQIAKMDERLWKNVVSRVKYEEENHILQRKTDEALGGLRLKLMQFLPEDRKEELTAELMEQIGRLRKKEEELGKLVVRRTEERREAVVALGQMQTLEHRAEESFRSMWAMTYQLRDGLKHGEERAQRLQPFCAVANGEDKGAGDEGDASTKKTERLRKRQEVAIEGLENAASIQKRIRKSLRQLEEEIRERLASSESGGHGSGDASVGTGSGSSGMAGPPNAWRRGIDTASRSNGTGSGSSTNREDASEMKNVPRRVELFLEEPNESLQRLQEDMERRLGEIDGKFPKNNGGTDESDQASRDNDSMVPADAQELDELSKLGAEVEAKDAEIESLQASALEHERTVEALGSELERLQESSREQSRASLEVMEKLEEEMRAVVERVTESDRVIESLTAVLQERKATETELAKEYKDLRREVKDTEPDFPEDMAHVGL